MLKINDQRAYFCGGSVGGPFGGSVGGLFGGSFDGGNNNRLLIAKETLMKMRQSNCAP